jgi:hypothetical protein
MDRIDPDAEPFRFEPAKPVARLHITFQDSWPDVRVEVLDGESLQKPVVDVFTHSESEEIQRLQDELKKITANRDNLCVANHRQALHEAEIDAENERLKVQLAQRDSLLTKWMGLTTVGLIPTLSSEGVSDFSKVALGEVKMLYRDSEQLLHPTLPSRDLSLYSAPTAARRPVRPCQQPQAHPARCGCEEQE